MGKFRNPKEGPKGTLSLSNLSPVEGEGKGEMHAWGHFLMKPIERVSGHFPSLPCYSLKGVCGNGEVFQIRKRRMSLFPLPISSPVTVVEWKGKERCMGKGEQNFHPFLFPLSSLHFTLPPALHGIENRESVETGKFFKSGKEGAFSIPIPAPVQGKGKGIYRHGVFFK